MDINYKTKLQDIEYANFLNYTLRVMNDLEADSLKDATFRQWVYNNFNNAFQYGDIIKFLMNVHAFINQKISYKEDLFDETIISPRIIIANDFLYGDCDDMALLIKTILKFFNINSRYILFSRTWGNFSHIANIVDLKNKNIYIDGVRNDFNILPIGKYSFYKII